MPILVNVPGVGDVEFPDGATKEQMRRRLQRDFPDKFKAQAASQGNEGQGSGVEKKLGPNHDALVAQLEQERQAKAPAYLTLAGRLGSGIEKGLNLPSKLLLGAVDLTGIEPLVGVPEGARSVDWLRAMQEREQFLSREDAALDNNSIAGQLVEGTARAVAELPVQLLGGVGAATTKAAVLGSSIAGGIAGGGAQYAQDRGEGKDRLEAATYGTASGLLTAVTTRAFGATGVESIFKQEGVRGLRNRVAKVLAEAGWEGAEEVADQFQQDLLERASREPGKPLAQSVQETLMAGAIGSLVGGGAAAMHQSAEAVGSQRAERAAEEADWQARSLAVARDQALLATYPENAQRTLRQAPVPVPDAFPAGDARSKEGLDLPVPTVPTVTTEPTAVFRGPNGEDIQVTLGGAPVERAQEAIFRQHPGAEFVGVVGGTEDGGRKTEDGSQPTTSNETATEPAAEAAQLRTGGETDGQNQEEGQTLLTAGADSEQKGAEEAKIPAEDINAGAVTPQAPEARGELESPASPVVTPAAPAPIQNVVRYEARKRPNAANTWEVRAILRTKDGGEYGIELAAFGDNKAAAEQYRDQMQAELKPARQNPAKKAKAAEARGEHVVAVASRLGEAVETGAIHVEAEGKLRQKLGLRMEDPRVEDIENGFLTNTGRFVGREEAYALAEQAKQLKRNPEDPGVLGREDLKSTRDGEITLPKPANAGAVTPKAPEARGPRGVEQIPGTPASPVVTPAAPAPVSAGGRKAEGKFRLQPASRVDGVVEGEGGNLTLRAPVAETPKGYQVSELTVFVEPGILDPRVGPRTTLKLAKPITAKTAEAARRKAYEQFTDSLNQKGVADLVPAGELETPAAPAPETKASYSMEEAQAGPGIGSLLAQGYVWNDETSAFEAPEVEEKPQSRSQTYQTRQQYEDELWKLGGEVRDARMAVNINAPDYQDYLEKSRWANALEARFNSLADEIELAKSKRRYILAAAWNKRNGKPLPRPMDMAAGPLDVALWEPPKPNDFDPDPKVRRSRSAKPIEALWTKRELESSIKRAQADLQRPGIRPQRRTQLNRIIEERTKALKAGQYVEARQAEPAQKPAKEAKAEATAAAAAGDTWKPGATVLVRKKAHLDKLHRATVIRQEGDTVVIRYAKSKLFESLPIQQVQNLKSVEGRKLREEQFTGLTAEQKRQVKAGERAFNDLIRNEGWRLNWYDPQHETTAEQGNQQNRQQRETAFAAGVRAAFKALGEPGLDHRDAQAKARLLPKLRALIGQATPVAEQQSAEFGQATAAGVIEVEPGQLEPGMVLDIEGEAVTVTSVDPETGAVVLSDGTRFGTQTLEDGQRIWVESVMTPEATGDVAGAWDTGEATSAGKDDFALGAPESIEQQQARQEAERAAAEAKRAKDKLAEKAAKGLTGTTGDLGQGDLLGGLTDLFAPPAPKAEAKPFGASNVLVSSDKAAALRARLKGKLGQVSAGVDPTIFSDALQLGVYYLEAGVRAFPEWSARMLEDLGEGIRPYLNSLYESARQTYAPPGSEDGGEQSASVRADGRSGNVGQSDRAGARGPVLPPPSERIVTARAELTKPADEAVIPPDLLPHLDTHQRQGAAKALSAMEAGGGFLLADGTGVGKTRQALAVAAFYARQGRPVVIVTKAETIKPDWKKNVLAGSYAYDAQQMGVPIALNKQGRVTPGSIGVTTYENVGELARNISPETVLIFDETHALKNADSIRSKAGLNAIDRAAKVMFMSATPADKPLHIHYLARMGILEGKTTHQALRDLGMKQVEMVRGGKTIRVWVLDDGMTPGTRLQRFKALFDRMTAAGRMLKREISMQGVTVRVLKLGMPPEVHGLMDDIASFFGFAHADDAPGLMKARILMHQRRQQEPYKIASTMLLTKRELAAGRQVVIFVSRVNESEVGKWEKVGWGPDAERVRVTLMSSEGTAKSLIAALREEGITDVAEIHGAAAEGAVESMAKFQNSKARVVVATVESGGTGINLDDTAGSAPRSMIVVTAPFSAVENVQAAGRIWRLKTKSDARIYFLFGDTDVDSWNADIIGSKMKQLGATVQGQVARLDVADPDAVTEEDFQNHLESKLPEARTVELPSLDWRPFKTKAGKQKFVAPVTKDFWSWYEHNGKGDNPFGLRVSKWEGIWQVWADKVPVQPDPLADAADAAVRAALGNTSINPLLNPQFWKAITLSGARTLRDLGRFTASKAQWAAAMVKRFSDRVRQYLDATWTRLARLQTQQANGVGPVGQGHLNQIEVAAGKANVPEEQKPLYDAATLARGTPGRMTKLAPASVQIRILGGQALADARRLRDVTEATQAAAVKKQSDNLWQQLVASARSSNRLSVWKLPDWIVATPRARAFKARVLHIAARLNAAGRDANGNFTFADFTMRAGSMSVATAAKSQLAVGDQFQTTDPLTGVTETLELGPLVTTPEGRVFHQLLRPVDAGTQQELYQHFAREYPELIWFLDMFIDPALAGMRQTINGVEVPVFNRFAAAAMMADADPNFSPLTAYTPDVLVTRSLLGAIRGALSFSAGTRSPGRKYKSGTSREGGHVRDLLSGFNVRTWQMLAEKSRREWRQAVLNSAVPIRGNTIPAGFVKLETGMEALWQAVKRLRNWQSPTDPLTGKPLYPETQTRMADDGTAEWKAFFGEAAQLRGRQLMLPQALVDQLVRRYVAHVEHGRLYRLGAWAVRNSTRLFLVAPTTYVANVLTNDLFTVEAATRRVLSGIAGRNAQDLRFARELVAGEFWKWFPGLRGMLDGTFRNTLQEVLPQNIFADQTVLADVKVRMDEDPMSYLRAGEIGAAALQAIRYGNIDVKSKQRMAYAWLKAQAVTNAKRAGLKGAAFRQAVERYMANPPMADRARAVDIAGFELLNYADSPEWLESMASNDFGKLLLPFPRFGYHYLAKNGQRIGALRELLAKVPARSRAEALADVLTFLLFPAGGLGLVLAKALGGGDDDDEARKLVGASFTKEMDRDGNVVSKSLPRDLITVNRLNLSAWARGLGLGTDREEDFWLRVRNYPVLAMAGAAILAENDARKFGPKEGAKSYLSAVGDLASDFFSLGAAAKVPAKLYQELAGRPGERMALDPYGSQVPMVAYITDQALDSLVPGSRQADLVIRWLDPVQRRRTESKTMGFSPTAWDAARVGHITGLLDRMFTGSPGAYGPAESTLPPELRRGQTAPQVTSEFQRALELAGFNVRPVPRRDYERAVGR